jgi:hypothetical protein
VVDVRDGMRTEQAKRLTAEWGLLEAEFVSTFPIPIDRAMSKGTWQVIQVLGNLRALGRSVSLVLVDANYDETLHRIARLWSSSRLRPPSGDFSKEISASHTKLRNSQKALRLISFAT